MTTGSSASVYFPVTMGEDVDKKQGNPCPNPRGKTGLLWVWGVAPQS